MLYIAHRINTKDQLQAVSTDFGTEIDLRDHGDRLILQHDPFVDGEDAEPFFSRYRHKTLILNVKSERIEHRILELMKLHGIEDFFFLDSSMPMTVLLARQKETRSAVRLSEYESIETVLNFAGLVDWVWVDCFSKIPVDWEQLSRLKEGGFKMCLVSPELQGRPEDIAAYKTQIREQNLTFDAICTKLERIPSWQA